MIDKIDLEKLYVDQKLSMAEIARALNTTHATVLYWMKRHGIARRSPTDGAYVKQNRNGDPFAIPNQLTRQQQELLTAALFLYWGEGSKTQGTIRIANLDHRMLQLFARFVREICHVQERRIYSYVRLHEKFEVNQTQKYWSDLLSLPISQVRVYRHGDPRSRPGEQWSQYGIATLEVHSSRLKRWLNTALDVYITNLLAIEDEVRDEVATIS